MAGITLAHTFVSAKGNGTDLTLIQPSNWNDQHVINMDANNLIGRLTAGNGPVAQIPLSTYMASLLGAADAPTLAGLLGLFSTGDGKITLKTTPDGGWLMLDDGTFGNVGSGSSGTVNGSTITNAVANLALFTLLYNNLSDTTAPVLTSAGGASTRVAQGSAATAWAAACRMTLPKQLGRAIVGAGAGSGLTSRVLGSTFGEESHTLTGAEVGPHQHNVYLKDPGHTHSYNAPTNSSYNYYGLGSQGSTVGAQTSGSSVTNITIGSVNGTANDNLTALSAAASAHNNTQASTAWNVMVKL